MAISRLSDTIRQRRIRLAGHCVRHPELMASEMILWEPTHGKKSRGSATVMAHASQPYSRMDSIHATKNLFLRPDFMFDSGRPTRELFWLQCLSPYCRTMIPGTWSHPYTPGQFHLRYAEVCHPLYCTLGAIKTVTNKGTLLLDR